MQIKSPSKIEALTLYTYHSGLAWAPAGAGHPHQKVCLALLGSLGGGGPKTPHLCIEV